MFKVKGNEYPIEFPSVGKFRRIETLKQILSSNTYNSLSNTFTTEAQQAADTVDIESALTVLCPDLLKDLKCNSFEDLGFADYMELRKCYVEQFVPWWTGILKQVGLQDE